MTSQALPFRVSVNLSEKCPHCPLPALSTPPSLRCPLLESSQPIFQQLTETNLKECYSPQSLWASLLP